MVPLYAKRKELEDIIDHIPDGNGLKMMDVKQKERLFNSTNLISNVKIVEIRM